MKKLILGILAVITTITLMACGNQKVEEITPNTNNNSVIDTTDNSDSKIDTNESTSLTNEKMYETIINSYKNAITEYNLDDIDMDVTIEEKYPLVNASLLMHVARYSGEGVRLTYAFYDIDKNGIDELIVGASGSYAAIYSYDKTSKQPVKICFLDTIERGSLSIYDNGVLVTSGAGGAALHYYEFGKISTSGVDYELLECIEEEYVAENEAPIYRDNNTRNELEYKGLDEIMDKYISNSAEIENIKYI